MQEKERFLSFLRRPGELAELQEGQQVFGAEEIQSFMSTVRDVDGTLHELAPLLPTIDNFHAGVLAILCGSLVESGGEASIPVEAVLELMQRQLQLAEEYATKADTLDVDVLFQLLPEATRSHYGLPFTLLAAMTMLCRDKEARKRWRLRQDVFPLLDKLEETYHTIYYVNQAFSLLDDQELLVLDPLNKRGFHVRMEGLQDRMYHCYALLQHAILEHTGSGYLDAEPTDPFAVRYAQNYNLLPDDYQRAEGTSDEQRFSFCYPAALRLDNDGYSLDPLLFFPGSASFFEIPAIDGMRVLLIGQRQMRFQWTPANMYPVLHQALASRVELVREMEAIEVEKLLLRIFPSGLQA